MTRKRFSAFLLASVLLLVFLTSAAFADGGKKKQTILTSGDYQYVLLEDGSAEILYCLSDDAEIVIPDTLDGHRVTIIDTISFSLSLTAVTLPNSVADLDHNPFGCCKPFPSPRSIRLFIHWTAFCSVKRTMRLLPIRGEKLLPATPFRKEHRLLTSAPLTAAPI